MNDNGFLERLLDGAEVAWLPLSDLCSFRRGSFPQPYGNNEWYNGEGSMPFVQVVDVLDSNFMLKDITKQRISKLAQSKSVFVKKGTVIVTLQGTIGRVAITQYDCFADRTIAIFNGYASYINKKYFAYQLKNKFDFEKENARGSTLKTITKEEFSKFEIPIPCPDEPEKSLAIQGEIVRILDAFTELTTELTTELNLRKKQYNHYRNQLLTFEDGEVEWKTLGEVCKKISSGKNKNKSNDGLYPVFGSTGIIGRTNNAVYTENLLLIARVGANAGRVNIATGKYDVSDNTLILFTHSDISLKFVYHFLVNLNLNRFTKGGGQPLLTAGQLKEMGIPVPPLEEQARIVAILDKFDTLTNSISEGLPREIELRQKQYEYYRDMLLNFPKPDKAA